jgi:hypothetical protein
VGLPKKFRRGDHGVVSERRDDQRRPPIVAATTRPFFASAAAIVEETWHELDRMARALDEHVGQLSTDSADRAVLDLITSGIREAARRLEQTEVALAAYLPTP